MKKSLALIAILAFMVGLVAPVAGFADEGSVSMNDLKQMNTDLMQQIRALQSKVNQLETRVVSSEKMPSGATYVAPSRTDEGTGYLKVLDGMSMSGYVDTSYSFNFNRPDQAGGVTGMTQPGRIFDRQSDAFRLHGIELDFEKLAPEDGGVGFRSDLVYGQDSFVTAATGSDTADDLDIQQTYIDINVPINGGDILGDNVNIQVGKFVTLAGFEVIESKDNWNFSRSMAFGLTIPFTHTGVRTNWSLFNEKIDFSLGINNGWDNVVETNRDKTLEIGLGTELIEGVNYFGTLYLGREAVGGTGQQRFLSTQVLQWETPIESLTLASEINIGNQRKTPSTAAGISGDLRDATWYSMNYYAKYDVSEKSYLAYRFEWFLDDDRFRAGLGGRNFIGNTLTYDYRYWENLITRLEVRWDKADGGSYDGGTDGEASQVTLGANVIYVF